MSNILPMSNALLLSNHVLFFAWYFFGVVDVLERRVSFVGGVAMGSWSLF